MSKQHGSFRSSWMSHSAHLLLRINTVSNHLMYMLMFFLNYHFWHKCSSLATKMTPLTTWMHCIKMSYRQSWLFHLISIVNHWCPNLPLDCSILKTQLIRGTQSLHICSKNSLLVAKQFITHGKWATKWETVYWHSMMFLLMHGISVQNVNFKDYPTSHDSSG